jgi:hypothetical protein
VKDLLYSWIGKINIVKMAILPKAIKIPMTIITETEKSTLKVIWKHKRLWLARALLGKKAMMEVSQYLTSNYVTKQ